MEKHRDWGGSGLNNRWGDARLNNNPKSWREHSFKKTPYGVDRPQVKLPEIDTDKIIKAVFK